MDLYTPCLPLPPLTLSQDLTPKLAHPSARYTREKQALPGARNRVIEWLNMWDFDEPDSLFFVFSDHGYQVGCLSLWQDT